MSTFVHWPDEYYFQISGQANGRALTEAEKAWLRQRIPDLEAARRRMDECLANAPLYSFDFDGFRAGRYRYWYGVDLVGPGGGSYLWYNAGV